MSSTPLVSIILLNFNGLKETVECLQSLKKTTYKKYEIIILDNGSDEREDLILKKLFKGKKYRFLRSKSNGGYCGGNNQAFTKSNGKYVVFLNNDTSVTPKWLEKLVEAAEKNPEIAVLQPKIYLSGRKVRNGFDYAGGAGGYIDIFGYPFTRGRVFETQEIDHRQYDQNANLFWGSGAAFFIRRDLFQKMGKFDHSFFIYQEEIDLCWSLHKAGFGIRFVPTSVIYHKGAVTTKRFPFYKRYLLHRNNLIFLLKQYPTEALIFLFPIRILLEVLSAFFYLFTENKVFCFSVFASLGYIFIHGPSIIRKRKPSKGFSMFREPTVYKGSAVFDYYIRGKKTFKDFFPPQESKKLYYEYTFKTTPE